MTSIAKKSIATVFAGTVLAVGVASPASAGRVDQDGLVNVAVNDVVISDVLDLNAAVAAVVQACGITVGPLALAVLGQAVAVDRSGNSRTICEADVNQDTILDSVSIVNN